MNPNKYLYDIDKVIEKESTNEVLETYKFDLEEEFVEQFEDEEGVYHVKTIFDHSDLDEKDLWEVYLPKNGSQPLELLLSDD